MQASSGVSLLAPAKITQIKPCQSGMELTVARDERLSRLSAKLVVLADGGRSSICKSLGIDQTQTDYGQHAIITNVAFEKPHSGVASSVLLSLAACGSAACRLSGVKPGSLVWTISEPSREELLSCDEEIFRLRLTQYFGGRPGRILQIGQRVAYPLSLTLAREQIRPGLVLLGMAHTISGGRARSEPCPARLCGLVRQLVSAKAQGVSPAR